MNAAQLLVSCLENEGVRLAFGIPGEENLELMDALRGSSVPFVLTRHEGAAAFIADAYGRLPAPARVGLGPLRPAAPPPLPWAAAAPPRQSPPPAVPHPA